MSLCGYSNSALVEPYIILQVNKVSLCERPFSRVTCCTNTHLHEKKKQNDQLQLTTAPPKPTTNINKKL